MEKKLFDGKDGATRCGYTDSYPFQIIKRCTERKMIVRALEAVKDPNWKPEMVVGGFCAHTVNNYSQKWILYEAPDAPEVTIRKHKNGRWYDKHGERYTVEGAHKFYDYNF